MCVGTQPMLHCVYTMLGESERVPQSTQIEITLLSPPL